MSESEKLVLKNMYSQYQSTGNDSVTMPIGSKQELMSLENQRLVDNAPETVSFIISTLTTEGKHVAKNL